MFDELSKFGVVILPYFKNNNCISAATIIDSIVLPIAKIKHRNYYI